MPNGSLSPMDRRIIRPAWRRRPIQLALAGLAAALGGAFLLVRLPAPGTVSVPAQSVDLATVRRAPFQDFLALRGEAVSADSILVTAATAGRVQRIVASDGEAVVQGATLATLVNPDLASEVTSRRSELSVRLSEANGLLINLNRSQNEREAQVSDVAYALHKAELELERRQQLRQDGIINDAFLRPYADEVIYQRARLDTVRRDQAAEVPVFAAQRRQIEASIGDLRRALHDLDGSLALLTVTAPASGRLSGFTLKPGQAVKPGDALGELDADGAFKMRAQVDEYFAARLRPGLPAAALFGDQSLPLTLSKIYQQVSDGRVSVEFQFAGKPPPLQPGQTMDVRLSLGDAADALVVPNGPWLRDSGGAAIFVMAADGRRADRRDIAIGRRNPDAVEVLGGLQAGERVITATRLDRTDARHLVLEKGSAE
jgi:HlyD family secretion protein